MREVVACVRTHSLCVLPFAMLRLRVECQLMFQLIDIAIWVRLRPLLVNPFSSI